MTSCESGLWLAYYGDDFSGSTDVMESLALAGLRTVLFLEAPLPETLLRFTGVRAVGVAGVSRSMTVAQMDEELPTVFAALQSLGAPRVHYKICSTFDSSPQVGSIGRAIELGRASFNVTAVPLVVGAPVLSRYCAFGNLFARSGLDSPVYRLDRHPTMSFHPTTPMNESDLRRVLGLQTELSVALIDVTQIRRGYAAVLDELNHSRARGDQVILFDTLEDADLPVIGQALCEYQGWRTPADSLHQADSTPFIVGSSGVEYALRSHWQATASEWIQPKPYVAEAVEQIVCVSGSCSPVTARQIHFACRHGFVELPIDPMSLLERSGEDALAVLILKTLELLQTGASVIVHSSIGPDDPRIALFKQALQSKVPATGTAEFLGSALGTILRHVVQQSRLRRVVVTGGDTSGFVARQLGIEALELVAPVAPGSPLCRVHARADDDSCANLQIAFKGGQVGHADYLVRVRDGAAHNTAKST